LSQTKGWLWKDILESKYGGWRSLKEQRLHNSYSFWWRDLKEVGKQEVWGTSFEDCFRCYFFWEDNLLGSGSLKSIFPRLFSLSVLKDAKISFCGAWVNNVWVWDLP